MFHILHSRIPIYVYGVGQKSGKMGSLSNYRHTNLFCLESFNKICDLIIRIYTTINPNVEGESAQEMYAFLRMNTAQDDWVACGESRSIYLYTNRLSCNISGEISNLPANVNWYVEFLYRGSYLQYPHGVIRLNHNRFQQVFCNQDFAIYKILTP